MTEVKFCLCSSEPLFVWLYNAVAESRTSKAKMTNYLWCKMNHSKFRFSLKCLNITVTNQVNVHITDKTQQN